MSDNIKYENSRVKINDYYQVNTSNTVPIDPTNKYNVNDIDICNSSSTTDCTGLMFRPPYNQYEAESYQDIYSFGPPDVNTDK